MTERYRNNRHGAKRQPLTELPNYMNTTSPSTQPKNKPAKHFNTTQTHNLPHNESLEPNGSLSIRNNHPDPSEQHKRVSHLAVEDRDSKRDSAVSSSSTNTSTTRKRKTFIGHWQLGKTIGKGGCSRVRVVRHRYRDQYGAVKIIARSTAENTRAQSLANLIESTRGSSLTVGPSGLKPIPFGLVREIAVMKLLEHPNIVKLYDVWENHNELYLIMEYVDGGELFHYIDERKGLPEHEAVYIFRQIISALLYCHRLRICHRDLKPENILLNQRSMTVKIIDFGMAALQPDGRLLSTPCGSPHYAAPEVVSAYPYDGTQADVWSCGVILYVMLTGMTPYNYDMKGDIRTLFDDITNAQYYMPQYLSSQAKDLIRRIFVPDPKRRITMDGLWEHPLMHKYDKQFGFDGPEHTKEAVIGEAPKLEGWRVKRIQDIDREILRNMRTLWHSDPEQVLIQKLLNNDINQEKLFYAALLKHREENQEDYIGSPGEMGYSASDYHHNQQADLKDAPPMPSSSSGPPRSQSQYSIMNNEHLKSSHSSVKPGPSVSSYDPYRASRSPMISTTAEYNVTVHRRKSENPSVTVARSLRHPNPLRIEMLKQRSRRSREYSNSSLVRSAVQTGRSTLRSSGSHSSLQSSHWASSPPIATMRPSDRYKRGVNFGHLRRTSTTSWNTTQASLKQTLPSSPSLPNKLKGTQKGILHGSSPAGTPSQQIVSRKEKPTKPDASTIKARRISNTPNYAMKSDIRKHSAELEKACEEAFFRSSVGSNITARTSLTDKMTPCDTPPSSVSVDRQQNLANDSSTHPLPARSADTPNTYLTRTLQETREKLAAYKTQPDDSTAKIDEVLRMLDDIMPRSATSALDKRISSAPEVSQPEQIGFLPVISEEVEQRNHKDVQVNWQRSVTAPMPKNRNPSDQTVRMVDPSSPGATPAPLVIKKRSSGSQLGNDHQPRLGVKASLETLRQGWKGDSPARVETTRKNEEVSALPALRKKRSGWFPLSRKDTEPEPEWEPIPGIPQHLLRLDDRLDPRGRNQWRKNKALPKAPLASPASSEFPMRQKKPTGPKKGFSKWFGKLSGKEEENSTVHDSELTVPINRSLDSLFSSPSPSPSSTDSPLTVGTERSWFARFFNIKPAVKIMCFNLPRTRARQELVLLLREWRCHGIRDLRHSRHDNIITARVDHHNALDIKSVAFRIELFVVLDQGRKVGLSIARFVQVKGSANGFRRVIDVVDGVMKGRKWLVEDEEKCRALCEAIGG